jgi:hypothetical protein
LEEDEGMSYLYENDAAARATAAARKEYLERREQNAKGEGKPVTWEAKAALFDLFGDRSAAAAIRHHAEEVRMDAMEHRSVEMTETAPKRDRFIEVNTPKKQSQQPTKPVTEAAKQTLFSIIGGSASHATSVSEAGKATLFHIVTR